MSDIPEIANADDARPPQTAADLLPLVYDELRRLAAAQMVREPDGHTLDGTALVHEAFLRLGGDKSFTAPGNGSPCHFSGVRQHEPALDSRRDTQFEGRPAVALQTDAQSNCSCHC